MPPHIEQQTSHVPRFRLKLRDIFGYMVPKRTQVHPGAKIFAGAGYQYYAHAFVRRRGSQRGAQFAQQFLIERIAPFGPVQSNPRDAALDIKCDFAPCAHLGTSIRRAALAEALLLVFRNDS